jgi:hypothetical protein
MLICVEEHRAANFDFVVEGVDRGIAVLAVNWIYSFQNTRHVGSCDHGNKHFGCTKCWNLLNYLRKCWFLRKDSYPWCLSVHGKSTD